MAKKNKLKDMTTSDMVGPASTKVEVYKPSKSDIERERKYKAEDALRDIERAKAHEKDKQLMKDVKTLAREKVNSLKKIC